MIDYLLSFPDEGTAHAVLDPLGFGQSVSWDESRVLPLQVIVGEQPVGQDEGGNPITAPVYAGGWWGAIGLPVPSDALYAVPYCMREADRAKAEAGDPYVIRERFTTEQLAAPWRLSRQWCGCDYSNPGAGA